MREITVEEAEKLWGDRLDRRRRYATTDDGRPDDTGALVFSLARWTGTCSGCFDSVDGHPVGHYRFHPQHRCFIGAGCSECGYTGLRRHEMWIPLLRDDDEP